MCAIARKPVSHNSQADTTVAVDAFMASLEHRCHAQIQRLRQIVLAADPRIAEGVKWNAPSFRTHEYFATTNLRAKVGVGLILHLGAKVRESPGAAMQIGDPQGLLKWLAKDRAMIEFPSPQALEDQQQALRDLLREWIGWV